MHIPDGVLSPEVCVASGVLAAGAVGYSLHRLKDSLADRMVPMTGMMAALIFAGQMVNFPIGLVGVPSVSGHLMGGVLAAAVLGPWAGCIAVALVLAVQCVLFADGGLLALGANVLNMGVVGAWGGYAVFAVVRRRWQGSRGIVAAAVVASWLSVLAAAALFCLELRLSLWASDYSFANIFTLMVTFHSAIGVGEALITGSVVAFVLAQRPDLIVAAQPAGGLVTGFWRAAAAGFVCSLAVAAFMAPFASEYDDGLEAVGRQTALDKLEAEPRVFVFGDYRVPSPVAGWENAALWQKISISLAGILGTTAVGLLAVGLGRTLAPLAAPAGAGHAE